MSRFQAPPAGKRHAIGFAYSVQKDVYADFLFGNEVAVLGVKGVCLDLLVPRKGFSGGS